MKIGYFVTACNEVEELTRLLVMLKMNISDDDVVGILLDESNYTPERAKILSISEIFS